jgi:hypothetical protein
MSQFKVGDVCEGVNYVNWPELNGLQCEVITIHGPDIGLDTRTGIWSAGFLYEVIYANGLKCFAAADNLRLKRPPPSDFTPAETEFTDWLRKQVRVVS